MEFFDDSMKVQKDGFSRTEDRENWTDGEVVTPWGIVSVYAQGDENTTKHTRLDFVWGGRLHMRNFSGKRYSKRGIKTKAMQFAKDIAS